MSYNHNYQRRLKETLEQKPDESINIKEKVSLSTEQKCIKPNLNNSHQKLTKSMIKLASPSTNSIKRDTTKNLNTINADPSKATDHTIIFNYSHLIG